MAYRPYPSAYRARHQLDRHVKYEDVPATMHPEAAQRLRDVMDALHPAAVQAMANARAAFQQLPTVRLLATPAATPGTPE